MIEIKFTLGTLAEASALLAQLGAPAPQSTPETEQPAPAKRTRKPKLEEALPPVVEVPPSTQPPKEVTAESLFGGAVQQAPAPVEQAKPKATQAHLINAFRNLANAKGTDPIVALLGEYKSKSVAAIPEAVWPAAIDAAAQRAGLTYAAAIEAPKS